MNKVKMQKQRVKTAELEKRMDGWMDFMVWPEDIPVGAETAGCLVEALGYNQCGCLLGTGTAGQSYPV